MKDQIIHWLHDRLVSRGQRWSQIDRERRDWKRWYEELGAVYRRDRDA